jgi:peroxiredoxin family protein
MTIATIVVSKEQLTKIIEAHYNAQGLKTLGVSINVGMTYPERSEQTIATFKNVEVKVELGNVKAL